MPEPRPSQSDPAVPPPALVPCGPCLWQLLTADAAGPHACTQGTSLGIAGGFLYLVPEEACPCVCQRQPESEALKAARAEARGETAG
ncbi:hypothetical protein [Streptomyces sp. NPDC003032]